MKEIYDILLIVGAGLSEDSGIPTFRKQHQQMGSLTPDFERLLTFENFQADPDGVWSVLKPLYNSISKAHYQQQSSTYECLQKLINKYPNSFILSQNIDGLTDTLIEKERVVKLHGDYKTGRCICKSCAWYNQVGMNVKSAKIFLDQI
jgi:NAD-dependent SIR2 family protein deacetylase